MFIQGIYIRNGKLNSTYILEDEDNRQFQYLLPTLKLIISIKNKQKTDELFEQSVILFKKSQKKKKKQQKQAKKHIPIELSQS